MAETGARKGTTINAKWRVDELLGEGGMAEVYAATHRNGKRAALKVLHRQFLNNPAILRRFRREGYAANRVGHPAVVTVDDDDVCEDGSPYLVMELLQGRTVDQLRVAARGKLPLAQVLRLGAELMSVVAVAHDRGIIHRDIKPSNLFLTGAGDLKVLDFGIARVIDQGRGGETTVECLLGTPAYMSPEQARGRWELVDSRSDIYSVGATLFMLLAGHPVHRAQTRNEQLGLAMTVQAPSLRSLLPDVSPPIAHIIDRALRYEREERWQSLTEMHRAWLSAIENDATLTGLVLPVGTHGLPTPSLEADRDGAEPTGLPHTAAGTITLPQTYSAARAPGTRRWLVVAGAGAIVVAAASHMDSGGRGALPLMSSAALKRAPDRQPEGPRPHSPVAPIPAPQVSITQPHDAAPMARSAPRRIPLRPVARVARPTAMRADPEHPPSSAARDDESSLGSKPYDIRVVETRPVAPIDAENHALDRRR